MTGTTTDLIRFSCMRPILMQLLLKALDRIWQLTMLHAEVLVLYENLQKQVERTLFSRAQGSNAKSENAVIGLPLGEVA